MKKKDAEIMKTLIGKRVAEILVNMSDEEDYGFEIFFDDGTVLEVYDLKCSKLDRSCYKKMATFVSRSGKEMEISNVSVGGGIGWSLTSGKETVDD